MPTGKCKSMIVRLNEAQVMQCLTLPPGSLIKYYLILKYMVQSVKGCKVKFRKQFHFISDSIALIKQAMATANNQLFRAFSSLRMSQ